MNQDNVSRARKFSWRGFTSLLVTAGFLLMAVTGAVLYISPRGRTANWTGWEVWGLGKEQWGGLHVNLAILLLAGALLHLIYNWKPFVSYLRSRAGRLNGMRRELASSLALLVLAGAGSVYEFPPFGTVLAWQEQIKDYWEAGPMAPAPYPHADESPLDEFAAAANLELPGVMAALLENGLRVPDDKMTVAEIAELNGLVPAAVYEAVRLKFGESGGPQLQAHPASDGGPGTGYLKVAEACRSAGIDPAAVVTKLAARGIDIDTQTRLFELAPALNTTPGKVIPQLRQLMD